MLQLAKATARTKTTILSIKRWEGAEVPENEGGGGSPSSLEAKLELTWGAPRQIPKPCKSHGAENTSRR